MGKTEQEVKNHFIQNGGVTIGALGDALQIVARGVDDLRVEQNSQKPVSESFGDKKAKALMIVIEKMVACMEIETYPKQPQFRYLYRQIFKLFEKAKAIKRAENETDFQAAIADL